MALLGLMPVRLTHAAGYAVPPSFAAADRVGSVEISSVLTLVDVGVVFSFCLYVKLLSTFVHELSCGHAWSLFLGETPQGGVSASEGGQTLRFTRNRGTIAHAVEPPRAPSGAHASPTRWCHFEVSPAVARNDFSLWFQPSLPC